ncbi:MAG: S-formylglutathione hydrolase [Salinisphaeraceae bacterium]|jgi:S-formylglutathione hydrolase|nr:S-formylglutathione hydrolase [Salinisphaeraceae bacterium]
MEKIDAHKSFGGWQNRYAHDSAVCDCSMTFAVYLPPQAQQGPVPAVYYLSGLTCTDENFVQKAGAQRLAAELGIALIAPDTSPRGHGLPGEDDEYDFGTGAGFYVNATQAPWAGKYNMYDYVTRELPGVIAEGFGDVIDAGRVSIMGHSMGGHGALVIALRNPGVYQSVSAFSAICAPSRVPWGEKALGGYLGDDKAAWAQYDATALVESGHRFDGMPTPLLDQGLADDFLETHLRPDMLEQACQAAGVDLTLRRHEGYDHSYFFIASFIDDHLKHHARALLGHG